jgi:hypothetical protein
LKTAFSVAALLGDEVRVSLLYRAIELAEAGDRPILRLLLHQIFATERRIHGDIPRLTCASDATRAVASIVEMIAAGQIAANEGAALVSTIEAYARLISLTDLEARMKAIEGKLI